MSFKTRDVVWLSMRDLATDQRTKMRELATDQRTTMRELATDKGQRWEN